MRKFAHDRRVCYPDGVFWVDADGPEQLRGSFVKLAAQLGAARVSPTGPCRRRARPPEQRSGARIGPDVAPVAIEAAPFLCDPRARGGSKQRPLRSPAPCARFSPAWPGGGRGGQTAQRRAHLVEPLLPPRSGLLRCSTRRASARRPEVPPSAMLGALFV
jgi:hypothetical protein